MDRVRLGRALGVGARQAAKNLMEMADAAISPDPREKTRPVATQSASTQVRGRGVAEGGRRFSESFFGRLKRLGGALWLEFTGVFFGVFALFGAQGVWKMRAAMYAGASVAERQKLFLAVGVTAAFGYFCISSFVRARRRERGRR